MIFAKGIKMNASVVYGMLIGSDCEESHEIAIFAYEGGKILVPNEEGAVISADPFNPKALNLGPVKHWDDKINKYCEEKGIAAIPKRWWLIAHK